MDPATKKFILENAGLLSVREIAEKTGLKEKNVRSVLRHAPASSRGGSASAVPATAPAASAAAPVASEALPWKAVLAVAGLAALVYSNALDGSFHFDDTYAIVQNPVIKDAGDLKRLFDQFNARFLTGLTLALNYRFGGLATTGYHLVNVALHAASAALVCLLTASLLRTDAVSRLSSRLGRGGRIACAVFAGAVFAAHPVQTQAVNYIWQRSAVLATMFYLAAVYLYLEARLRGNDRRWMIGALAATVGSMLSKEISLTLPAAIVWTELAFVSSAGPKERLKALAPFLACVLIVPALLVGRSTSEGLFFVAPAKLEGRAQGGGGQRLQDLTRWESSDKMPRTHYYLTQLNVLRTYLRLYVFPVRQSVVYKYPVQSAVDGRTAVSALLVAAALGLLVWAWRRCRLTAYGIGWFFLTLSMETLVPLPDVIFEHRLYLPLAGLAIVSAAALWTLLSARLAVIAGVLAVSALGLLTYQRNPVWASEETLWSDAMAKHPEDPRPYAQLGNLHAEKGEIDQATAYLERAVELAPWSAKELGNLGGVYYQAGRIDQALAQFEKAIELGEAGSDKLSLSAAYSNAGNVYSARGQKERAKEYYLKAVAIDPLMFQAYNNLCIVHLDLGDPSAAVEYGRKSIEANPDFIDAHYNLGVAYIRAGRPDQARTCVDALAAMGRGDLAERLDGILRRG